MLSPRSWPVVVCGSAVCALLAGGTPLGAQASGSTAREQGASQRRVECFELRKVADGPAVGFASLHRTDSGGGTQLEWQVSFPEDDLNIWHVESREAQDQRWIWRERRRHGSRSVVAAHVGAAVEVTEWGRPIVWRALLPAPGSCCFPLELEERLRAGEVDSTTIAIFDPLANAVESVRLEVGESNPGKGDGLRRVDLVRADGSLAGSWTFLGRELVSFRWQRGGLIAVRVDEASYAKHKLPGASAESAAASPNGH